MPRMDGQRLCRYIKADPHPSHIPVIILTGVASVDTRTLDEIGADRYILKDKAEVMIDTVLQALEELRQKRVAKPEIQPLLSIDQDVLKVLVNELIAFKRRQDAVYESLGEGLMEVDTQKRVVSLNPAALEILGRTELELVGRDIVAILDLSKNSRFEEVLERLISASTPLSEKLVITYRKKVLSTTITNLIEDERPGGLLLVIQDITPLARRLEELEAVNDVAILLGSTLELPRVLQLVMDRIQTLIRAEAAHLLLADEQTGELVYKVVLDEKRETIEGKRLKSGKGVAGWVFQRGEPVLISNSQTETRFYPEIDALAGLPSKSILCVPLKNKDNILGVIQVVNRSDVAPFTLSDLSLLSSFAIHAAIAIDNAKLYWEIKELAIRDSLTGLYNFRYFRERLIEETERSQRFIHPLSLIFLDLDHFKKVNDTYGHLAGDEVLKETSSIISKNIRSIDIPARYGGEEFALLLPETGKDLALRAAERIRRLIEIHPFLGGYLPSPIKMTTSAGVATFPDDTMAPLELIKIADQALYRAKEAGRNRVFG